MIPFQILQQNASLIYESLIEKDIYDSQWSPFFPQNCIFPKTGSFSEWAAM